MSTIMNTTYKIAIGADHAGVDLKETVVELLKAWGHEVTDMGTMTKNSCDYSDYANEVASSIADGTNDRGILICRSGIGMSIAANRWVGVRAALCRTAPAAALSRQHNDSNLLCLASAYVDNESVEDVLDAWLHADFEGGRHERRVVKSSGSPLQWTDPELAAFIQEEGRRESNNIELIASENIVSKAVLLAMGTCLTNKYAEGYPGKRYYGGCYAVDVTEELARQRACQLFDCAHANVQPHSGANANLAAFFALLQPGDTVLSMNLAHGGHLSHGSPVNISGKYFRIVPYGVSDDTETIDYEQVMAIAKECRPKLILAGASAYPRTLDFAKFREIADAVGARLMVDMAHIAGLVAAGVHPSPIPYADVVTTTTHKTLRGPRGGMILCNDDDLYKKINSAVFPGTQGGPLEHIIAAKAVCLGEALKPEFRAYGRQVAANAGVLAEKLIEQGFRLVSGGTDNHLILVDTRHFGLTGKEYEHRLDEVGITVNKNTIPNDPEKPFVTSGIRVGTPAVTTRGFREPEMAEIARWMGLMAKEDYADHAEQVRAEVAELCKRFPLYQD